MALTGGFDTSLDATPRHDDGTFGEAALERLVPADEVASACQQEFLYLVVDPRLQLVLGSVLAVVVKAELPDFCLAPDAVLPAVLGALVASDVDELRGENVAELTEDGLDERHRLGVAGAEHLAADAPFGLDGVGAARATQVGEDVQGTLHVSREVDFGNDIDVSFGGIADYLTAFVLGVVASVGLAVVDAGIGADDRLLANAALQGKLGQGFHLETPALVLGEVPVELVAAVQGHDVEHLLDGFDGEEVTGTVEQDAAIGEAGLVLDDAEGEQHGIGAHQRQALAQRLCSAEDADGLASGEGDGMGADGELVGFQLLLGERGFRRIGFLSFFLLVCLEANLQTDGGFLVLRRQQQTDARCLLDPLLEELCRACHLGIGGIVGNAHACLEREHLGGIGADLNVLRQGNDAEVGCHLCFSIACNEDEAEKK